MENFKMKAGETAAESKTVFSYPIHTHTYCEMTLYFPFDGNISVNNQDIFADTVTAILINPFDFHKIDVKEDCGAKYIKISFDESCLAKDNIPETSFKLTGINPNGFLASLFAEAYAHCDEKVYFKFLINAIVYRISTDGEKISSASVTGGYKAALEAVKMINENFCSGITLQSAAKSLYITPQYLSQVFKSETGMGFAEYVVRMRLGKASALLADTADSVTDICFLCGYNNLSHFLRSFKREYGLSPNKYRTSIKLQRSLSKGQNYRTEYFKQNIDLKNNSIQE